MFRTSYQILNLDNFEISTFETLWGELGPLMTPFGVNLTILGVNFPHLGDQVVFATKESW